MRPLRTALTTQESRNTRASDHGSSNRVDSGAVLRPDSFWKANGSGER